MEDISVFDVIGPNMIGPSSSHTAGALKIALMARHLVKGPVHAVTFRLFGSFARTYRGHGTDRALIAGILGFDTEDRRIRDAYELAEQAGLKVTFEVDTQDQDVHPNTVRIQLVDGDGRVHSVEGSSIGGGEVVDVARKSGGKHGAVERGCNRHNYSSVCKNEQLFTDNS